MRGGPVIKWLDIQRVSGGLRQQWGTMDEEIHHVRHIPHTAYRPLPPSTQSLGHDPVKFHHYGEALVDMFASG